MIYISHILFVCTGNTCRSVMAEALLKHYALKKYGNLPLKVSSAGISALEGAEATPETRRVLQQEEGIEPGEHCSRPVTPELIEKSRLIIVMTVRHKNAITRQFPGAVEKVKLLKELSGSGDSFNLDISDPFGEDIEKYRETLKEISRHVQNLVNRLEEYIPEIFSNRREDK